MLEAKQVTLCSLIALTLFTAVVVNGIGIIASVSAFRFLNFRNGEPLLYKDSPDWGQIYSNPEFGKVKK